MFSLSLNASDLQTYVSLILSIALGWTMLVDIRERIIPNWVVLLTLALAPAMWGASGLTIWPDIALRLLGALLSFALFAAIFTTGKMGGGDVKLITALSLWFAPKDLIWFLILMSLIGGAISLAMLISARLRQRPTPDVPYGVAISLAAMAMFAGLFF